jgi:2-(1,2-epoxy-1,2-dihydrophenyl)acetyl-CoA isomerase
MMASSEHILFDVADGVATLRLNDPASRNALSSEMIGEMRSVVDGVARSARVMVLAGSAKTFCSGANLVGGLGLASGPEFDAGSALEQAINPLMLALRDLEIPWIAAVNGAAAGVGASLALAADLIVAGESAYFLQAFRRIGLVPDGGSTWLLTRAVGRPRAMEMMLLGEKVTARQALDWGMINRVAADDKVEETAFAFARTLAAGPRRALGLIRRAAWIATDTTFATALKTEREFQREAGRDPDFREGVQAFLEKRPARFGAR